MAIPLPITETTISTTNWGVPITNRVNDLDVRMPVAESDIATAEANIATLQSGLATVQTDLDTAESDIATLESGLSTVQTDLDNAELAITGLNAFNDWGLPTGLDGNGDFIYSQPSPPAVTGDITVIVKVQMDWSLLEAFHNVFVAQYSGAQMNFQMSLYNNTVYFQCSADGTAIADNVYLTTTAGLFTPWQWKWLAVTYIKDDGTGVRSCKLYSADDNAYGDPGPWTLVIEKRLTAAGVTRFNSTAPVTIGGVAYPTGNTSTNTARFAYASVANGTAAGGTPGGSVTCRFDARKPWFRDTYIDDKGFTWARTYPWVTLTYANGWVTRPGGFQPLQIRRRGDMCDIRGEIANGVNGTSACVAIDKKYRPLGNQAVLTVINANTSGAGLCVIRTDGIVAIYVPSNTDVSIWGSYSVL